MVFAEFSDANATTTVSFWICTITGNSATYGVRLRQLVTKRSNDRHGASWFGQTAGLTSQSGCRSKGTHRPCVPHPRAVAITLLPTRLAAWSASMIRALATLTL